MSDLVNLEEYKDKQLEEKGSAEEPLEKLNKIVGSVVATQENLKKTTEELSENQTKLSIDVARLHDTTKIDRHQALELKKLTQAKVVAILVKGSLAYKELSRVFFPQIWHDFYERFVLTSYIDTYQKDFLEAKSFLINWQPSREMQLMIMGANSQMNIDDIEKKNQINFDSYKEQTVL